MTANLKVDQATADVEFFVDEELNIPLPVGQPFTEREHITMVRWGKTLRFCEENINEEPDDCLQNMEVPFLPKTEVKLWAEEATVISSNVGFISANKHFSKATNLYIEHHQIRLDALIPNCVISNDTGDFTIPILNVTKQDIKLEKNDPITNGRICVE